MRIFTGIEGQLPKGEYDALRIRLAAKVQDSLDWKDQVELAKKAVEEGYKLFWELDLGLFSRLRAELSDSTQYQSLLLGLDHFVQSVWTQFGRETVGVSLYRGTGDWQKALPGAADFFSARNQAAEYLALLTRAVSDTLPLYLQLDVASLGKGMSLLACHGELFSRFSLALRGGAKECAELLWEGNGLRSNEGEHSAVALLLPAARVTEGVVEKLNQILSSAEEPLRVIPECYFPARWEGVEEVVVLSDFISEEGERALMGFAAAEGKIRYA